MIIIVEGPDGLGKTTFCALLSESLGFPVYKDDFSSRGLELSREYITGHDRGSVMMAVQTDADVILDRSFPSEAVYSRVFGRAFNSLSCDHLDWEVSEHRHLAVMISSQGASAGWKLAMERGNSDLNEEDWLRVWDHYRYYVDNSRMKWHTVYAEDRTEVQVLSALWRLGY